jgi:predicted peptidase
MLRGRLLELLLATAVIALVAQLVGPWSLRWLKRPGPGDLGVVATESGEILVYLPREYGKQSGPWPLVVFLHGSGGRGADISLVRRGGLPRLLDEGLVCPCVVAAPQCRQDAAWRADRVMPVVDSVVSSFHVDPARIYLTGYSMGGFGTWQIAAREPARFAAIVPLCGGGDIGIADSLRGTPVWAFHGSLDEVVPVAASQEIVDSITSAGGEARLSVLDGLGHDICRDVYRRRELFDWLLSKRLDPGS